MSDMFGGLKPIKPLNINIFRGGKGRKRTLGRRDRETLYHKAKGKCEACDKKIDFSEMQCGHRRAYSKGGATSYANSACLCYRCNKLQGTGSLETLKKKLKGTYGTRSTKRTSKVKKPKTPRYRGLFDFR